MTNEKKPQPAVLIGGPPHAGKSTLTYSLMRALRKHGVAHYVMRACPDGEGHWTQEIPQQVREVIRHKGVFSDAFIQRACTDIEHRQLPFIVDVGGLPQGEQFQIFQHCTDAILLRHRTPADIDWHAIVQEHRLELLADFISDLDGTPLLTEREPVLKGTLVGLQRGTVIEGEPFDSLVALLIARFTSTSVGLSEAHTALAPTELVLNLPQLLGNLAPGELDWEPQMLPHLLELVPANTPFSAYGRAPHWVYSALLVHTSASFFQFDARLGWLQPLPLQSGPGIHPEITFEVENRKDCTLFHCYLHNQNLAYAQLGGLNVPVLPIDKGVILSGKLPLWLFSALTHFYQQAHLPWIAGYYPQRESCVVVYSRVPDHVPGDLIPLTLTRHRS